MTQQVSVYFTMMSPWAYIGHAAFLDIARRHNCAVAFRPMRIAEVFGQTGGAPLAKRHPVRQAYRLIELQRWRLARGVELNLHPPHWPFDTAFADLMVIAAAHAGADPSSFMGSGMKAVWAGGLDLGDRNVVIGLANDAGLPGEDLAAATEQSEVHALYDAYTDEAIKNGYFGSPCYVLNGEPFWGQDRLELLNEALASGRAPFRPEEAH